MNFLTTERSEVVPFFRAVRPKERGREATPIVLRVWGHPPFVSFLGKTWSKRQRIWTKLGRNDLWAKPDGITRPLFLSATRGLRYLALKAEKWAFWLFLGILRQFRALTGGQVSHKACAGIL